jgi:sialidase-1
MAIRIFRCVAFSTAFAAIAGGPSLAATEAPADQQPFQLTEDVRHQCLKVLRDGLHSDEFWPAIHAAEALTLAGYGDEVKESLAPKLQTETDDQKRCGLARELVRAGDLGREPALFRILEDLSSSGRVHAAESLFKVNSIGDGRALREAFAATENATLRMMAAAALAQ